MACHLHFGISIAHLILYEMYAFCVSCVEWSLLIHPMEEARGLWYFLVAILLLAGFPVAVQCGAGAVAYDSLDGPVLCLFPVYLNCWNYGL